MIDDILRGVVLGVCFAWLCIAVVYAASFVMALGAEVADYLRRDPNEPIGGADDR